MIWLVILSMLVMAAYTAAVCIKQKGVPYSISATFYAIEHKGWFRFAMWVCPALLMPAISEVSRTHSWRNDGYTIFSNLGSIKLMAYATCLAAICWLYGPKYRKGKRRYILV